MADGSEVVDASLEVASSTMDRAHEPDSAGTSSQSELPDREGAPPDELAWASLAIRAYDQEKLEAQVFEEANLALAGQERQRQIDICLKELKPVLDRLQEASQKRRGHESELQSLARAHDPSNRAQHRRAQLLLDEQEKLTATVQALWGQQRQLVVDLGHLDYDLASDPSIRLWVEEGAEQNPLTPPDPPTTSIYDPEHQAETAQEKRIRLGEMTAFGTTLKTRTDDSDLLHYNAYVKDQRNLNAQATPAGDLTSARGQTSSSLKTLSRPVKTGARSQRPSKASETERVLTDNGTDDSDWESSASEEDQATGGKKGKKRKRGTIDDGNREDYLQRLDRWQKEHGADQLNAKSEALEGGLHVPSRVWDKLYNYQRVCVQWLWELHQQRVGGILGDEMGLGKTIQIIAFLASLSFSQRRLGDGKRFGPVLIVCPTTVMHQWVKEFHTWWPLFRVAILHESGSHEGSRLNLIRSVASSKGVLITSFNGIVAFQESLVEANFEYVILDEGHKIRNPDAKITLSVKTFPTAHRLILSGSPLQNNLKELWSLFDFIYPSKLGTLPVFMQQFSVPITQGGYANASRVQVATAFKCATILRDTINPYLLRRMKSDVKQHINLPEKNEQVLFCRMTEEQRDLYKSYLDSGEIKSILEGRIRVFVGLINLRKICNHPDLYDGGPRNYGPNQVDRDEDDERYGYWKRSGKMVVIEALLRLWKKQDHRVLLFSQSRQMLTILEKFVTERNYNYMKLDGTTAIGSRQCMIDKFNSSAEIFVFLLTTKVGGLGVNLTGASRVVIFDPDWNPSTDTQARERAWRIGQKKQVTIYRLMTAGTIEEKIYHRQIFKQFLVNRVLKDPKQKRFFKSNDLYELFTLNEGTTDQTETSAIFAGTGSDVRVKRRKGKKSNRASDSSEAKSNPMGRTRTEAVPVKARNQPRTEDVKMSLSKVYESARVPDESEMSEERKILMDKVRKISQKITEDSEKKDLEKKPHPKLKRSTKRGKFEGTKISNLVQSSTFEEPKEDGDEKTRNAEEQDNYVLSKLFKKSGVHSAVQHDAIVDGKGDDYVLIEGEAEKVAKEAVDHLRASRRQCFRAEAGVPTWTGSHGRVASKVRFGKKLKRSQSDGPTRGGKLFSGQATRGDQVLLTSKDLLTKMKERNRYLPSDQEDRTREDMELFAPDNGGAGGSGENPKADQIAHLELLADIRNFTAFQAKTDGQAQTIELLERFKTRLPPQQSPLFKALLKEICHFNRDPDGRGIWTLRGEFA